MDFSKTHPSNIIRYCPKCGHNNFVFDNIKSFDCQLCGFKYYINEATAVAVIIELTNKQILLTRRKYEPAKGMFDLPGGFVDIGERAEDAAIREVKEELGIDIDSLSFLATFPNEYVFKGISYYTCDIAFVAKVSNNVRPVPADDVSEVKAVLPADIDFNTISFTSIKNILKEYIKAN